MRWCCEQERDAEDRPVRPVSTAPRLIYSSNCIALKYPKVENEPTEDDNYVVLEMRRLYKRAKRYESAVERAKVASGLEDALRVLSGLHAEVSHYAFNVTKLEALTLRGVAIKANAIDLARRFNWDGPDSFNSANHLSRAFLLPDVVRISKGGAA